MALKVQSPEDRAADMERDSARLMDEYGLQRVARPVSPVMEAKLGVPLACLDKGFVRPVDYMGDDNAIVQAARVSYGKGTKTPSNDEGLIRYLMRHWHSTPFEMCEVKLHVKLPLFVARQWLRHRTANVNEYSARYSILDREFYFPDLDQWAAQSKINGQGRNEGDASDNPENALQADYWTRKHADQSYEVYDYLLREPGDKEAPNDNGLGMARELARMNLPANIYTQMYWKTDLHNLFHFLRLRADPHAQYEIRVYAEAMLDLVREWVPMAARAFIDYRMGAVNVSGMEFDMVRDAVQAYAKTIQTGMLDQYLSRMSKGERREFLKKFDLDADHT